MSSSCVASLADCEFSKGQEDVSIATTAWHLPQELTIGRFLVNVHCLKRRQGIKDQIQHSVTEESVNHLLTQAGKGPAHFYEIIL